MTIHYKSEICDHDCTISGGTYSNLTKGCLNAMMNNKLIRERYSEENSRNL